MKDTIIHLRVDGEFKAKVVLLAKSHDKSLSNYIIGLLMVELDKDKPSVVKSIPLNKQLPVVKASIKKKPSIWDQMDQLR